MDVWSLERRSKGLVCRHVASFCVLILSNQRKQMALSFLCVKSQVVVATRLIFSEFIKWKGMQVSDIYRLFKRIQFLIGKKSCHLLSCASLVTVEFTGAFNLLVAD